VSNVYSPLKRIATLVRLAHYTMFSPKGLSECTKALEVKIGVNMFTLIIVVLWSPSTFVCCMEMYVEMFVLWKFGFSLHVPSYRWTSLPIQIWACTLQNIIIFDVNRSQEDLEMHLEKLWSGHCLSSRCLGWVEVVGKMMMMLWQTRIFSLPGIYITWSYVLS
jgi:hypothetical protein